MISVSTLSSTGTTRCCGQLSARAWPRRIATSTPPRNSSTTVDAVVTPTWTSGWDAW